MRKKMVALVGVLVLTVCFVAPAMAGTVANGRMQDVTFGLPGPNIGSYTIDDAGDLTLNIGGAHTPTACFPNETLDVFAVCDFVFFAGPFPATLDASGKFVGELVGVYPPDTADSCPAPVVLAFGPASGCFLVNGF